MRIAPWFIIIWSFGILAYGMWIGYRVGRNDGYLESFLDETESTS